jgi:hypothetical protein
LVAITVNASACRAALPSDLRALSDRTDSIEARYDKLLVGRDPILGGAWRASADLGPFHITRIAPGKGGWETDFRIEERGRLLAQIACRIRKGSLLSNPPQSYHEVECHDASFDSLIHVDLFNGGRTTARIRGGPCFMPRVLTRDDRVALAARTDFAAIRLYECATGPEGYATAGNLAAAAVVRADGVFLMFPRREPDRTIVIAAFLVALASAPPEELDGRPRDLNQGWP